MGERKMKLKGETVTVTDEKDYRSKLIGVSRLLGCETELIMIFNKYDTILRNCTNKQEAEAIATMGVIEVSNLFDNGNVGKGGSLIVNGNKVLEDKTKEDK